MNASTRFGTSHWRSLFLALSALALAILACDIIQPVQVLPTEGAGSAGGNLGGPLKPVGFVNHGSVAATVMAWTYIPLGSDTPAIPSNASTVSFPPTAPGLWPNSSRFLLLPLGTYTWCYYWEIGDINNDGMMEYSHAIDDRPIILDESDSDDTAFAENVDLSAPPDFGIVPGMCGAATQVPPTSTPTSSTATAFTGVLEYAYGDHYYVEIQDGVVVGGWDQGTYYWTAVGGSFDGTYLEVTWETSQNVGCQAQQTHYLQVEATQVFLLRYTICGVTKTSDKVFQRIQ